MPFVNHPQLPLLPRHLKVCSHGSFEGDEQQWTRLGLETDTLDPVQMEQEIEKEGLEVTSTAEAAAAAEEEDTALADIEGRLDPDGHLPISDHSCSDGAEEDVGANNIKLMMDVFVTQLPTCVNREMIDKVGVKKTPEPNPSLFDSSRLLVTSLPI